ncbi:hypothetical protein FBY13_116121 [Pantoea sp. SJZ147]|nr:hypothetical protein FBY13_116121 [Pantoea sp. SJZ147]
MRYQNTPLCYHNNFHDVGKMAIKYPKKGVLVCFIINFGVFYGLKIILVTYYNENK